MKDMTQGSIARHILSMSGSLAFGMIFQTLYFLVDLYFVAHLSGTAIAGVSTAGTAMFIVFSLTQVLGVATSASISHAVGRKDPEHAHLMLNQSLLLSALGCALILLCGYLLTPAYMHSMGADAATAEAGVTFLYWTLPGLALQFPLVAMGAALRGTGIVRPPVIVQSVSVILNILLAPVLIAGWGTGYPMGVAGAGLASTIAMSAAVLLIGLYFLFREKYLSVRLALWRPHMATWRRFMEIGLPAGGEFLLSFLYVSVTYYCIREFGSAAQAGAGVGARVMQALFLPAMAIAFAAGPIAGQNFGARDAHRVRRTFRDAATLSAIPMIVAIPVALWQAPLLVGLFTPDPDVRAVAITFLHIMSWAFIAQALVYTCSSLFQGLQNTRPALLIAATRVITFVAPALWLSSTAGFHIEQLWYLSVVSTIIQAATALFVLHAQMRRRLSFTPATTAA